MKLRIAVTLFAFTASIGTLVSAKTEASTFTDIGTGDSCPENANASVPIRVSGSLHLARLVRVDLQGSGQFAFVPISGGVRVMLDLSIEAKPSIGERFEKSIRVSRDVIFPADCSNLSPALLRAAGDLVIQALPGTQATFASNRGQKTITVATDGPFFTHQGNRVAWIETRFRADISLSQALRLRRRAETQGLTWNDLDRFVRAEVVVRF